MNKKTQKKYVALLTLLAMVICTMLIKLHINTVSNGYLYNVLYKHC